LAQSLRAGGRALDQAGGKRTIKSLGQTIEIDVPAGYVLTSQVAEDFDAHYLRKVAPLGNYPGHLLLYVGGHPDTNVPTGQGSAVSKRGKLAGQEVDWRGWSSPKGGVLVATLPLKSPRGDDRLKLQVVEVATLDGEFLEELAKIADSIRVR
jgi:hypothetical protein